MSSKRKNTPTKLATDEVLIQREPRLDPSSDGDSRDSLSDLSDTSPTSSSSLGGHVTHPERHLSLHIVSKPEQLDDINCADRPQSKKQRILQSVKCDVTDSDADMDSDGSNGSSSLNHINNNNILTKPTMNGGLPLHNKNKSMDNVLRRLNSKASDGNQGDDGDVMMDTVHAAISTVDSLEDKEKKLAEMIAHLQNIKDNLSTQKKHMVSTIVPILACKFYFRKSSAFAPVTSLF